MSNRSQIIIFIYFLEIIVDINCYRSQYNATKIKKHTKDIGTSLSDKEDLVKIDLIDKNITNAVPVKYNEVGINTDDNEMYNMCPFYKKNTFSLDSMVDVWQTVFYQAKERVPCFKILIRKLNITEKKKNARNYGSFYNQVFWDNCTLEIKSDIARKHFLQETPAGNGILQNIIIETDNTTRLVPESPDQWFVQKNLLLMKDCGTGDVVVFARVPYIPSRNIIAEGLGLIGASTEGNWTCDEPAPRDKEEEFEIFSDIAEFL